LKNLKGVAFRGMGLLEIADAEEFVEMSLDVLEEIKEGNFTGHKGVGDICTAMGETDISAWLEPLVHRHSSCYNTPYPTNTFACLDDDPKQMAEAEEEETGGLITDIFGLIGFKKAGLSATDACLLLRECARDGIDAAAVAELSQASGLKTREAIQGALPDLSGPTTLPGNGIFSPWCPQQPLFGEFENVGADPALWWERRMAVAYIFGIHPIFAVMSPEITEEDLVEIAAVGTELEIDQDTLDKAVHYLLS
jgi:aldehyde:ferredoxin oxidoreductase